MRQQKEKNNQTTTMKANINIGLRESLHPETKISGVKKKLTDDQIRELDLQITFVYLGNE